MKRIIQIALAIGWLVASGTRVVAQLNVPSDGSDGALNISNSVVIDLSQASYGAWNQNNATNAGNGVYDPAQWAVVFKYSSVNIAAGATVTFLNHSTHAPVVWLVQSNVTISGTVSLDGGALVKDYPDYLVPTEPGPGGFRGGGFSALGSGAGFGPGGMAADGAESAFSTVYAGAYGTGYGNPEILPLMGGSGGGGDNYSDFGAPSGAGAILIVAANCVSINGVIEAVGKSASVPYGAEVAGDGAIRIVANQVLAACRT